MTAACFERNKRKTGKLRPREFLTLFGGMNVPFVLSKVLNPEN
jgi:hypothetical protein